jgi:heme b synthase
VLLPASDLRMVFWELTAGCNLSCLHCRRLDQSKALLKSDLSTDQAKTVLLQIAETGNPIVVFSGGEPLMRPDFFELAEFAKKLGLDTALASNGTLIDSWMAEKIKYSGIRRVAISLDGVTAEIHDAFRGEKGAFKNALKGCCEIHDAGISLQINTTLTRHNINDLEYIYDLALSLGAEAFHLFMLVPVGCGLQIARSHQIEAETYEYVLKWLYKRSQEKKIHIRATCAPHYFRIIRQEAMKEKTPVVPYEKKGLQAMTKGCLAGSAICFISHQGHVFPCGYLPISCGKVPETHFSTIWNESIVFHELRDTDFLRGKCGRCEFKKVCMGCRARAYYETGDYLEEEPLCLHEPSAIGHERNCV